MSVFPTDVGVIHGPTKEEFIAGSIPHGCGGDPNITKTLDFHFTYSPRMWG